MSLFNAVLSLFNLVLFNIPLINYAFVNSGSIRVTVSITLLAFTLNFFACYFVCSLLRAVGRVLVALCNMLSAACVYFIVHYKVIMDETMIGNVFNTNASEASGFVNLTIVAVFLAVGVLPAVFILLKKIEYPRLRTAAHSVNWPLTVLFNLLVLSIALLSAFSGIRIWRRQCRWLNGRRMIP